MFSPLCLCLGFLFFGHSDKPKPIKPEVEFVRVWPQYRDEGMFKRISEYFTNREAPGKYQLRRSRPSERPGYYFLARVRHPDVSLEGAHFELRVVMPDDPAPKAPYIFQAEAGPGEQVFLIGLTGKGWPGPKVHPVAWRLDLVAGDGHPLAWAQSFLWSKPGAVPTS
jgi:hypothetical protein